MQGDTESLVLPSGFQIVKRRIFYEEEWDEEVELVLDSNGNNGTE